MMQGLDAWYAWAGGKSVLVTLLQLVYITAALLIIAVLVEWRHRIHSWRGKTAVMDKNSRRRKEQIIVSDIIEDGFSEAVEENALTATEARYWKHLIGQHCNLPDLLPKNNSFNLLRPEIQKAKREALKARIRHKRAESGELKPVPLPGDPVNPSKEPGLVSLADSLK